MKTMEQLWTKARGVAQRALDRADGEVHATERARLRYEALPDPVRQKMQEAAVVEFGQTEWDDYMRAIGGTDARQGTKSA